MNEKMAPSSMQAELETAGQKIHKLQQEIKEKTAEVEYYKQDAKFYKETLRRMLNI